MEKSVFLTQNFTALKHQPPMGLGYFDATYTPATKRLLIEVRFQIGQFVVSYGTDAVKWTDEIKHTFKQEFCARVPEYWNNKFIIHCIKDGWTDIEARPEFTLLEAADPHFDIKAQPTLGSANTAVRPYGTNQDRQPNTVGYATAVFGSQAPDRWANAEMQMGRIKDHMKLAFSVPIVQGTTYQFSFFSMSLLQSFANNVKYAFKDKKKGKPTLRLTTVGEANTTAADKVKAILEGYGVKNHIKTKKGTGMGPATSVNVGWNDDKEFDNAFPKAPQSAPLLSQATIVHEYGHMLGLPDEYNVLCSGSQVPLVGYGVLKAGEMATHLANNPPSEAATGPDIEAGQAAFMDLCQVAGVLPPPFGRATMNVMSGGSNYERHHCLSVWNCLCGLTDGIIQPKEWEIRMA